MSPHAEVSNVPWNICTTLPTDMCNCYAAETGRTNRCGPTIQCSVSKNDSSKKDSLLFSLSTYINSRLQFYFFKPKFPKRKPWNLNIVRSLVVTSPKYTINSSRYNTCWCHGGTHIRYLGFSLIMDMSERTQMAT